MTQREKRSTQGFEGLKKLKLRLTKHVDRSVGLHVGVGFCFCFGIGPNRCMVDVCFAGTYHMETVSIWNLCNSPALQYK